MPLIFPAHQGLILPVVRRWPESFDALALSIGAAMPDITDSVLGFSINGYFNHWYGHTLLGAFAIDMPLGLLLTWVVTILSARFLKDKAVAISNGWQTKPSLWVFSMVVGIISHLGFDLFTHDTNLLFCPWYDSAWWYPEWWHTKWFEVQIPLMFDHPYSVGIYTVISYILSFIGAFLFYRFVKPKMKTQNITSAKI